MSIHELEKDYENYIFKPSLSQHHIGMFMQHTINTLKEQSDMIADLRQELRQVDIDKIKIYEGTD